MTGAILPPAIHPDLSDPKQAKAWKAAQQFEAMALGQLLEPMFDTVDTANGPFGGGPAEAAWKPMLVQEMAKQAARTGGIGIAPQVFTQLLRMQDNSQEKPQ